MKIRSTYSVKIRRYNRIFKNTVKIYRGCVGFFIGVALREWGRFAHMDHPNDAIVVMETLSHATKKHPDVPYDFDGQFPKFPSYLRRAAIKDAVGLVSSYMSNLARWETSGRKGREPSPPVPGNCFPVMYKDNMYEEAGTYTANIKIYDGKQWAWMPVDLRKSDIDYILRHCSKKTKLAPSLVRRGKEWSLDFVFEESMDLNDTDIMDQVILSVDLGINNACVCTVITADGAVHGRHFLKLPVETDRLWTAINRIRQAQQHGARKMPRLWGAAKGINKDIAVRTAKFIMEMAELYSVDVIVFEHLDLEGRKHGSKKQRLHLWKAKDVQAMVEHKAHKDGIRIRRICAWGTSRLAFDGSGSVTRGTYMQDGEEKYNYSICVFPNGKTYNCDLNASYNIGARYFIREILKSVPATARLALEAKVPPAAKRSTSTLSTLISLNAELKTLVTTAGGATGARWPCGLSF